MHSMCSRIAMFPPQLVRYFVLRYTMPNDVVADCWGGMGSVPLEACLTGRYGAANDISPEAFAIMKAKIHPPTLSNLGSYLSSVESEMQDWSGPQPELDSIGTSLEIPIYYHPKTLAELLKVRQIVQRDIADSEGKSRTASFAEGLMLGVLHGDRNESISLPMDSSKAISPTHVRKMIKENPSKFTPEYKRHIIDSLRLKARKVLKDPIPKYRGRVQMKDASRFTAVEGIKLLITSPPYMGTHTYAYDNRIRLWYLGYQYKYVDRMMNMSDDNSRYFGGIERVLIHMQSYMDDDSAAVVVFGDIRKNGRIIRLGEEFANRWESVRNAEFKVKGIITDRTQSGRKRYYDIAQNGMRLERLVVLEKGHPRINPIDSGWASQPITAA